jgi:hypothetical protein
VWRIGRSTAASGDLTSSADSLRAFVAGFVAAVLIVLGASGLVNYLVNPYGLYPSAAWPPYSWNLRQAKLDRLQDAATAPEVLFLGSSRAFGLRPQRVAERCGLSAYNASVPSGRLIDHLSLFKAALTRRDAERIRVAVLQLDLGSFWRDVDIPLELRATPSLLRYASGDAPAAASQWLEDVMRVVSSAQLLDSIRSVRQHRAGQPPNLMMDGDGVVHFASREDAMAHGRYDVQAAIAEEIPYEEELFREGHRVADVQIERFRAIAAAARAAGVKLVVWLSPVHPALIDVLRPLGWDQQRRLVVALLERLQQEERFELYDLSTIDRFGGGTNGFLNATHVTASNADRIVDVLLAPVCG